MEWKPYLAFPLLDILLDEQAVNSRLRTSAQTSSHWDGIGETMTGHKRRLDVVQDPLCPQNYPVDRTRKKNSWLVNKPLSSIPDVTVYTDGSKEGSWTGAGWLATHGEHIIAEDCIPLGQFTTVFQAEVIAITEALTWTKLHLEKGTKVSVRSDSQAAIQAIFSRKVSSEVVKECQGILAETQSSMSVHIEWIKGHADHSGNEAADALAKEANKLAEQVYGPGPAAAIPLVEVKQRIKNWHWKKWQRRWKHSETCRQSKIFFPDVTVDTGRMKKLTKWSRANLNLLFMAGTGHALVAYHISKWKPTLDPTCELCLEEEETTAHLFQSCPALEWSRREMFIDDKEPIWDRLLRFFNTTTVKNLFKTRSEICEDP